MHFKFSDTYSNRPEEIKDPKCTKQECDKQNSRMDIGKIITQLNEQLKKITATNSVSLVIHSKANYHPLTRREFRLRRQDSQDKNLKTVQVHRMA